MLLDIYNPDEWFLGFGDFKRHHGSRGRVALNVGADVSEGGSEDGSTPLHVAATRGYKKAIEELIAVGADVEAVNEDGNTP